MRASNIPPIVWYSLCLQKNGESQSCDESRRGVGGGASVPCLCLSCSFWPESALSWPLFLIIWHMGVWFWLVGLLVWFFETVLLCSSWLA